MNTVGQHNLDLLKNYNTEAAHVLSKEINLNSQRLYSISFEPFESQAIKRLFGEGIASQIQPYKDGFRAYIEPRSPSPGSNVVFIENISERKVKSGDTGVVDRIYSSRVGKDPEALIRMSSGNNALVKLTSFVLDPDYKFLYFCKAYQANKSFLEDSSCLKKASHFTYDERVVVATCKYHGQLTKEKIIQAKLEFSNFFPLIAAEEEKGALAILVLPVAPKNPKQPEYKSDAYVQIRTNTFELGVTINEPRNIRAKSTTKPQNTKF